MRRLQKSAERAATASSSSSPCPSPNLAAASRFSGSKRIPSWNCIARENSAGSLEEDHLSERRNKRVSRGTDSESEGESVELSSWTRSGGPLMRTTSSEQFSEFLRNWDSRNNYVQRVALADGSGIVVSDGDLLHAEKIQDGGGILLNVVKLDHPSVSSQRHDGCEVAECLQLECPGKDMDTSSASEEDGDDDEDEDHMRVNKEIPEMNLNHTT